MFTNPLFLYILSNLNLLSFNFNSLFLHFFTLKYGLILHGDDHEREEANQ